MTDLTIKDANSIKDLDVFFEILCIQKERDNLKIGSDSYSQIIRIFNSFRQELFENQKNLKKYAETARKVLEAITQVDEWRDLRDPNDLDEEATRRLENKCTREEIENALELTNRLPSYFEFLDSLKIPKTKSEG